ncbi:MAG: tyrosine--tRNA ligase [Candidatus Paceibacterota bacterium]
MAKIIVDEKLINEVLNSRYIEAAFPSKDKIKALFLEGRRLSFYLGVDPTGPDIHLGHTTNLFLLKRIAELGHKIIILIGDFTARIGDPTDKESSRKALTEKEVKENMKTYLEQVQKVLPRKMFEVKYNSAWLKKMSFEDVIRLASKFTVQQMIARDMFQERIKKEKPIFIHEFLYPLMQGYDSVAMEVDGEVGGNDQTFNMLVGRDLSKEVLGKDKVVIATKLLEDPKTGKKLMNKSEGQYISLNDAPNDLFGKVMAMPDQSIIPVLSYATEVPDSRLAEVRKMLDGGENPKMAKEETAYELVKLYYGEKEAQKAKEGFGKVFSEGKTPDNIEEFQISEEVAPILEVLEGSGLANSRSEAKRLVDQKAVTINGEAVEDWGHEIKKGDILKVGSHRFLKIV